MSLSLPPATMPIVTHTGLASGPFYRFLASLRARTNLTLPPKEVRWFSIVAADVTANFTSGKGNVGGPYDGWAICDGSNGTPDLADKFVRSDTAGAGTTGTIASGSGENYHELVPLMRLEVEP